uniref:Ig-like domain-containing protein n=1 Tax=Acrobeloides nanus TaxID=290746 RepID=A0A914EJY2_9BILA
MCYNDRSPRCKVVIEKDTMKEIRGIYKILNGIINMTCAINSLPTPVNILWKYRPKTENKFISVPCGNEQKTESCNVNENGEHHTVGHCSVPTNHLTLSGFYRCEALQSNGILVASNESEIEIIGIEYTNKVQDRLVIGEDGYIDVKICANPQPELFWVLPQGQIIQPGHGQLRFSASNIWHDQNKPVEKDGPSERIPYCYRNKLIIGSVAKEDKEIFLIVRNEGETREHTTFFLHL